MDLALWALDDVKPGVAGSYITSKLAESRAYVLSEIDTGFQTQSTK